MLSGAGLYKAVPGYDKMGSTYKREKEDCTMAKQSAPVKKNQTVTLTFEDLTHEGSGVGKINGYPLFVPYALPGEEGEVKVVKVKKKLRIRKTA